jgi:hypothetical protein
MLAQFESLPVSSCICAPEQLPARSRMYTRFSGPSGPPALSGPRGSEIVYVGCGAVLVCVAVAVGDEDPDSVPELDFVVDVGAERDGLAVTEFGW